MHRLDLRTKAATSRSQVHTPNNKVTSLAAHPVNGHLLLTASNDHFCKLFDVRMLKAAQGGRGYASSHAPLT